MIGREDIPEHHMTTHQCHNTAKNNNEENQVATVCLFVSVSAAVWAGALGIEPATFWVQAARLTTALQK